MRKDIWKVKLTSPDGEDINLELENCNIDAIRPIEHNIEGNILESSPYIFYSIVGFTRTLQGTAKKEEKTC